MGRNPSFGQSEHRRVIRTARDVSLHEVVVLPADGFARILYSAFVPAPAPELRAMVASGATLAEALAAIDAHFLLLDRAAAERVSA